MDIFVQTKMRAKFQFGKFTSSSNFTSMAEGGLLEVTSPSIAEGGLLEVISPPIILTGLPKGVPACKPMDPNADIVKWFGKP